MMNSAIFFLLTLIMLSCDNSEGVKRNTDKKDLKSADDSLPGKQPENRCFASYYSDTSSHGTVFFVDVDSSRHLSSIKKYFLCIKEDILSDPNKLKLFRSNHDYITINFTPYYPDSLDAANFELIQFADTSRFWPQKEKVSLRERFLDFLSVGEYSENWESVINELLQENVSWKYGAENVYFFSKQELAQKTDRFQRKDYYPYAFEIVLLKQRK